MLALEHFVVVICNRASRTQDGYFLIFSPTEFSTDYQRWLSASTLGILGDEHPGIFTTCVEGKVIIIRNRDLCCRFLKALAWLQGFFSVHNERIGQNGRHILHDLGSSVSDFHSFSHSLSH